MEILHGIFQIMLLLLKINDPNFLLPKWAMDKMGCTQNYAKDLKNFIFKTGHVLTQSFTEFFLTDILVLIERIFMKNLQVCG